MQQKPISGKHIALAHQGWESEPKARRVCQDDLEFEIKNQQQYDWDYDSERGGINDHDDVADYGGGYAEPDLRPNQRQGCPLTHKSLLVEDLFSDLSDGVILLRLIYLLTLNASRNGLLNEEEMHERERYIRYVSLRYICIFILIYIYIPS
ncbi:unnamed protein product [Protopolystoma xenopodis]|uniref:Uncharacterized protein n=1 Tax=Protopolystoma xenopodis TaxID=117903 RepID=A0A448WQJ4_9PLAT|nr:unnamed protein product [Protopolystoma xenopodis]